ncbi:hypothetical protein CEUSTIGMA_g2622.t1 [Chlamydomonas eustigma]|uniref:DUF8204 domain-containing protein n=1 Tax=Chlamydomonas eustigma TaxID=1157962 RepID=A0A250WWG3_9CHLO|nr:hypothetical protein CEUSTIGMA_g2622.t1 [Chlamydomonas eustigma]|eukprot:GAX75178.1 hypothetical protein CEUSTIGMA_g2622.t1 [Chlamydomonas eustigma]
MSRSGQLWTKNSCCLGFAYFNKKMQEEGKVPFCLGVRHLKEGHMKTDISQKIPPNMVNYKFSCLGYSSYPYPTPSGEREHMLPYCEGVEVVGFEELEVSVDQQPEGIASDSEASVKLNMPSTADFGGNNTFGDDISMSSSQRPSSPDDDASSTTNSSSSKSPIPLQPNVAKKNSGASELPRDFSERFKDKASHNLGLIQAALRGEGPVQLPSWEETHQLKERLWRSAQRNAGNLSSTTQGLLNVAQELSINAGEFMFSSRQQGPLKQRGSDKDKENDSPSHDS